MRLRLPLLYILLIALFSLHVGNRFAVVGKRNDAMTSASVDLPDEGGTGDVPFKVPTHQPTILAYQPSPANSSMSTTIASDANDAAHDGSGDVDQRSVSYSVDFISSKYLSSQAPTISPNNMPDAEQSPRISSGSSVDSVEPSAAPSPATVSPSLQPALEKDDDDMIFKVPSYEPTSHNSDLPSNFSTGSSVDSVEPSATPSPATVSPSLQPALEKDDDDVIFKVPSYEPTSHNTTSFLTWIPSNDKEVVSDKKHSPPTSDPDAVVVSSDMSSIQATSIPSSAAPSVLPTSAPSITKIAIATVVPTEQALETVDAPGTDAGSEETPVDDAPTPTGASFLVLLLNLDPFAIATVVAAFAIFFLVYRWGVRRWTRGHEVTAVVYSQVPQGDIEMLHTLRNDEAEEEMWEEWESDNEGNATNVTGGKNLPDKDGSLPHQTSAPSVGSYSLVSTDKISMNGAIPSRPMMTMTPTTPSSTTSRATSRSKERKHADVDLFEVSE